MAKMYKLKFTDVFAVYCELINFSLLKVVFLVV